MNADPQSVDAGVHTAAEGLYHRRGHPWTPSHQGAGCANSNPQQRPPLSDHHICDLQLTDGPCGSDDAAHNDSTSAFSSGAGAFLTGNMGPMSFRGHHRWRNQLLMLGIVVLGLYLIVARGRSRHRDLTISDVDLQQIEEELEHAKTVASVTFQPPHKEQEAWADVGAKKLAALAAGSKKVKEGKVDEEVERTMKFHRIWSYANKVTNLHELFSDTPDVEVVLTALATAKIVHADVLDPEEYESGTSEKWVVTLEGGQKAMMKLSWEKKGTMKKDGLCNFGYEMPWAEIAAFHLHRIIGFRNTPYAAGRKVDIKKEILPVASPAVSKQITVQTDGQTCVTGKCFHCDKPHTICPPGGIVEASVVYWVPRRIRHYTFPPKYMPFSTPNMKEWKKYGFNNKTYCEKLRNEEPYNIDRYYHDLFDFAVIDTLMYHYDSKHYIINENSDANGLTIRLDHGRAFCAHDRDQEDVFLAPLLQCCILRRETYWSLRGFQPGQLADRLRGELARDALAPLLDEAWYRALERRRRIILQAADKCAKAVGGLENMFVG